MRKCSKPSTAKCNISLYTLFLMAEPKYVSCERLSEILEDVSHDSVNRFLLRERYSPKDLFEEVASKVNLIGGILSIDDSVEDKPYRDPKKSEFVDYFWSGKHKRSVKGINLITLYYTDPDKKSYPINFRLYDKREGKTKNDYFREMVKEVIEWGIVPSYITGDSWYSSLENLKFIRNEKVSFLFGIANNRQVSIEKGKALPVKDLEISEAGLVVYLKSFGWVKVFCQQFKNEPRYYIVYHQNLEIEMLNQITRNDFKSLHDSHWQIEEFHRVIKQVCNVERFFVRDEWAIRNHFFCALRAFCHLQTACLHQLINNCYEFSRKLFIPVIRQFIMENITETMFA